MSDRRVVITRRRLLRAGAVGAATGLAGCNDLDVSDLDTGDGPTTTTTDGTTTTSDSDADPVLELVADELVDRRSPVQRPGIRLRVAHRGTERFETVEVEVQTADASDVPLSVGHGRGYDVDPGETFETFVPLRDDPANVASYRAAFTPRAGDTVAAASALTVSGDALEDAGYTKRVTGAVANAGDELGYAEVRGKFYDGAGRLLCTDRAVATSMAAGGTWDFAIDFVSDDPSAHERVADYSLEVGGRWWSP